MVLNGRPSVLFPADGCLENPGHGNPVSVPPSFGMVLCVHFDVSLIPACMYNRLLTGITSKVEFRMPSGDPEVSLQFAPLSIVNSSTRSQL
jgi:hypothetical protein